MSHAFLWSAAANFCVCVCEPTVCRAWSSIKCIPMSQCHRAIHTPWILRVVRRVAHVHAARPTPDLRSAYFVRITGKGGGTRRHADMCI